MAESKSELDHLTCSICVDVYREPVSLPCNHSYCRQCLHMFADPAKDSEPDYSPFDAAAGASGHVTISCPVCRTSTVLGPEGVAGLAINTQLVKAVNQANNGMKEGPTDDSGPSCSMCEGDGKSAAVKVCTTCNNGVLYCEECCSVLHPMRGPFKHHTLVSVEDYLSRQTSTGVDDEPEASPPPKCPLHSQLFSIYCISCQEIICNSCLQAHDEHTMGTIKSSYERVKACFRDKMTSCEEMKTRLRKFADGFDALQEEVQGNEDLHVEDIKKAYKSALETLKAWKKISLELVGKRHADRRFDCKTEAKYLRMKAEELDSFMDKGQHLLHLSASNEEFLQSSTELSKRMDDQLQELTKASEIQTGKKEQFRKSLSLDPVTPRRLVVEERIHGKVVSRPPLRFTPPGHSTAQISEEGLLLRLDESLLRNEFNIITDGVFRAGRYYWEVDINVTTTGSADCGVWCAVGLVRSRSEIWTGAGKSSWGFVIGYSPNDSHILYFTACTRTYTGSSNTFPHTGPHRLGLYLSCEDRTLTLVDCSQNRVVYTYGVRIRNGKPQLSLSARLIHGDCSNLPQILLDTLKTK